MIHTHIKHEVKLYIFMHHYLGFHGSYWEKLNILKQKLNHLVPTKISHFLI
jgi:hypothetical protein